MLYYEKGIFDKKSISSKAFILLAIILGCTLLAMFPITLLDLTAPVKNAAVVLRTTIFIQDLFMFILAAYIAQDLFFKEPIKKAMCLKMPLLITLALGIMAIFTISPLTDALGLLNQKLQFPDSMEWLNSWIRSSENSAQNTVNIILNTDQWPAFIANILILGVLAGVSEEIMFRGIIQKMLIQKMRNPHVAIFITAFIFSAIHLQFLGFFPRLVMGMLLGYLYYFSKSIWVPIFAHGANNFLTIVVTPCPMNKDWKFLQSLYHLNFPIALIIVFLLVCVGCVYAIKLIEQKKDLS